MQGLKNEVVECKYSVLMDEASDVRFANILSCSCVTKGGHQPPDAPN